MTTDNSPAQAEQPLWLGITFWTFPIWWPFLYLVILAAVNLVAQRVGTALYLIVHPNILLIAYLSGFCIAYLMSLKILRVSPRMHLYNLIIMCVVSGLLFELLGATQTTLTMLFAQVAGCPRSELIHALER